MKTIVNAITFTIVFSFLFISAGYSQYASKAVRPAHKAYTDSIKSINYDRVFPFWGAKAYKRGIDIPYPIGIMTNALWMDQGLLIDNMQLGLQADNQDIPLTPIDFI